MSQSHVEAVGGGKSVRAGWQARAHAALFGGEVHQRSHTSADSVLEVEVPSFGQRYHGWRAGLGLRPASWWSGLRGTQWRPSLKLSTLRVHDTTDTTALLRHRDRAGVLSFAMPGRIGGLGRSVHTLDLGAGFRLPHGVRAGLAWRHMQVDAETDYSLTIGLRWRFQSEVPPWLFGPNRE